MEDPPFINSCASLGSAGGPELALSLQLTKVKATKMVEHYMLLYNKFVAETLYKYDKLTILRTHKVIDTDFYVADKRLGSYLNIINQNAALYQINPKETCHQDLEMEYYTHATSPIRRYVDIINQKNIINYLANGQIVVEENLEKINLFQKNLRKFYNHHKKLDIIFSGSEAKEYEAFIVGVEGLKISIYIPDLDIEHSFLGISSTAASLLALSSLSIFQFVVYRAVVRRSYG